MIPFIEDAKDAILAALNDAKGSFDTWKVPWTQARAEKLDSLDKTISSRASAADYTPTRAAKLDHLDRVGTATDTDTTASLFGKLAEIKKISAERRTQIAATLGRMDVSGLSGNSTAKVLADGLDSVPIVGAIANTLTTTGATYTVPRGYHNGGGKVQTDIANLTADNVKQGVNVGGVIGTFPNSVTVYRAREVYFNADVPANDMLPAGLVLTTPIRTISGLPTSGIIVPSASYILETQLIKTGQLVDARTSYGNVRMYFKVNWHGSNKFSVSFSFVGNGYGSTGDPYVTVKLDLYSVFLS